MHKIKIKTSSISVRCICLICLNVVTTRHFQLGPALGLSTLYCSSTHNNALQVLKRTIGPRTSLGIPWVYTGIWVISCDDCCGPDFCIKRLFTLIYSPWRIIDVYLLLRILLSFNFNCIVCCCMPNPFGAKFLLKKDKIK